MAKHKNVEVKKKARRIVNLGRLPKGKVTVDDVIATNDINEALAEVQERRAELDGLLIAWRLVDGTEGYRHVKMNDTDLIALCELIKHHAMHRWTNED